MIHLTKLNNQPLVLNSDLIELIEITPDTVITLTTGNKVVVLENTEEVIDRVVAYRQRLMAGIRTALPAEVGSPPGESSPETL